MCFIVLKLAAMKPKVDIIGPRPFPCHQASQPPPLCHLFSL